MELKIDPEFESVIPTLTEDEQQQLEENILSEGRIINPLIIWNGIIVDGHNRYHIAQRHPQIAFQTYEKQFASKFEALAWICKNQLGRRNLTPQQKKYLVGERYEAQKQSHGASERFFELTAPCDQFGHMEQDSSLLKAISGKTRKEIARDTKTSEGYVERAGHYAKGVDAAEEALPGIKLELLSGSIKPTETAAAAIAKAAPEDRPQLAQQLRMSKDQPQRKSNRQALQEIRDISDSMAAEPTAEKRASDEAGLLFEIQDAVSSMIWRSERCLQDDPKLLQKKYKPRVLHILEEANRYYQHIGGLNEYEAFEPNL